MKILIHFFILSSVFTLVSGCGSLFPAGESQNSGNVASESSVVSTQPFNYDDYAKILKEYVNEEGLVNYQALQENRQQLDQFVAAMGAVPEATYQSWDDKKRLAFLINAYNVFTLQSIIDQKPIKKSIRDIPGVWRWRKFKIAGQQQTLDNIEHDTIRVEFNEPRIHVALVCAAMSCPILRNEPYTGENLETQLEEQVQLFIASPHGFRLDKGEGKVFLSSIYKWFGSDWKKSYGVTDKFTGNDNERAVLNFLSRYLNPSERDYLVQGNYKIAYLDYDWSLNKQ